MYVLNLSVQSIRPDSAAATTAAASLPPTATNHVTLRSVEASRLTNFPSVVSSVQR